MKYNIISAFFKIEPKYGTIYKIAVLVDCTNENNSFPLSDVRLMYADTKPKSGYFYFNLLQLNDVRETLLQQVAAAGQQIRGEEEIKEKLKEFISYPYVL